MTDPMHRSEIKPPEIRGPWKWHIEEVFKGLVTLGVESLKIMALINGGAAVAILAYLGNIASRTPPPSHMPHMRSALLSYSAGVLATALAFINS